MRGHHHSFRHISVLGGPVIALNTRSDIWSPGLHLTLHLLPNSGAREKEEKQNLPMREAALASRNGGKKEKTQVNE